LHRNYPIDEQDWLLASSWTTVCHRPSGYIVFALSRNSWDNSIAHVHYQGVRRPRCACGPAHLVSVIMSYHTISLYLLVNILHGCIVGYIQVIRAFRR